MHKHDLYLAPLFAAASNMTKAEELATIRLMRRMYRTEQRLRKRLERVGARRFLPEAIAIAKRRGDEARNRFVMQYVRFVVFMAKRYRGLNGRTLDELVSFGLFELMQQAPRYQLGRGAKPITYFGVVLKCRMRRFCGIATIQTAKSRARHTANELVLATLADSHATLEQEQRDREETTAYRTAFIEDCLPNLDAREQDVIRQRYLVGSTLREVGDGIGISHERCRQIEERGLERLKKHFEKPIPTWVAKGAPVLIDRRAMEFRRLPRDAAGLTLRALNLQIVEGADRRESIVVPRRPRQPRRPPVVNIPADRPWVNLAAKKWVPVRR